MKKTAVFLFWYLFFLLQHSSAQRIPMIHANQLTNWKASVSDTIYVINFWATWCPPCREEMPELSQLQQEYQNKNVVVLGIAVDEVSLVKAFTQATPVSYPLVADENTGMGLAITLGNDQGVLPYTVIIDTNGKVIQTFFGRISKPLLERALAPLLMHL